jgi:O-antigen/teichoic acid export membrane protein
VERRMSDLIGRLRAVTNTHAILFKNSGAIAIGNLTAAILGFAYWWLAARWLPPEVIGTASALISVMAFIGLLGDSGFGTLLTGEIIRWPGREGGLISAVILTGILLSVGTGTVILVISEQVFHLLANEFLINLCLIIGFSVNALSLIIDDAWLGMMKGNFRMIRQFIFATLKLVFFGMAIIWRSDIAVIVGSWIMSLFFSIVISEALLRQHNRTFFHRPDFALLFALKSKVMHHYFLDLASAAPYLLMPYLVAVLLSSSANAVFTMLWMIVLVAAIVPATLAAVLFPTIQAEPHHYRNRMSLSLGVSLVFALIFGFFMCFFSTDILKVFNRAYVEIADGHLRMLGFGVLGIAIKSHICAAARLNNRMREASVSVFLAALFGLACVAIGAHIGGLEGIALGWTVASLAEAGMLWLVNPIYGRTKTIAAFGEVFGQ